MDRIVVEITPFMAMDNKTRRYSAAISIDGEFFKQVGGVSDPCELLECIADSLRNDDEFQSL